MCVCVQRTASPNRGFASQRENVREVAIPDGHVRGERILWPRAPIAHPDGWRKLGPRTVCRKLGVRPVPAQAAILHTRPGRRCLEIRCESIEKPLPARETRRAGLAGNLKRIEWPAKIRNNMGTAASQSDWRLRGRWRREQDCRKQVVEIPRLHLDLSLFTDLARQIDPGVRQGYIRFVKGDGVIGPLVVRVNRP